jgi:hypothetical protein
MWVKDNTAFVVIHGGGPHKPFQMLNEFVENFRRVLEARDPGLQKSVKWEHRARRRDGWIEDYVSAVPLQEGAPRIDFHEYYWDCYATREITPRELMRWVEIASKGAMDDTEALEDAFSRIDAEESAGDAERIKRDIVLTRRGGLVPRRVPRAASGDVSEKTPGEKNCFFSARTLRRLFIWAAVYFERFARPLAPLVWKPVPPAGKQIASDLVTYTSPDVRASYYATRTKILDEAVALIRSLIEDEDLERIVLVAHSLGSFIGYDALNRITRDMNVPGPGGLDADTACDKMVGFVTFGTGLEIVADFFRQLPKEEVFGQPHGTPRWVSRQVIANVHGFKRRRPKSSGEHPSLSSPYERELENTRWLHFYHLRDPFAEVLKVEFEPDESIRCEWPACEIDAHVCYWQIPAMYERIADAFVPGTP